MRITNLRNVIIIVIGTSKKIVYQHIWRTTLPRRSPRSAGGGDLGRLWNAFSTELADRTIRFITERLHQDHRISSVLKTSGIAMGVPGFIWVNTRAEPEHKVRAVAIQAACSSSPSSSPPTIVDHPPAQFVEWPCAKTPEPVPLLANARRGELVVPVNRTKADGPTMRLAIATIPSETQPPTKEPIVGAGSVI
ncbi:hypothetical protein [Rhodococcus opacus]|uniref:hypothetical protein n=1 Tax=Rhodococcus opacus TaxID=37919 RepID=UPI0013E0BFC3|nr:hypothetical protein [Rhodococcus opacus]